jgi:hypothetical protein
MYKVADIFIKPVVHSYKSECSFTEPGLLFVKKDKHPVNIRENTGHNPRLPDGRVVLTLQSGFRRDTTVVNGQTGREFIHYKC